MPWIEGRKIEKNGQGQEISAAKGKAETEELSHKLLLG
jgi:hypothetical protein